MRDLFSFSIDHWASWGLVFSSKAAFEPLIQAIYAQEGLAFAPLHGVTPGTNTVFRSGETVIKVFAPPESGANPEHDFFVETAMLRFAAQVRVPTTNLIAAGKFQDRYCFHYIITEYVDGALAGDVLSRYSATQRQAFAENLESLLAKLHKPLPDLLPKVDIKARALCNPRLKMLPHALQKDLQAHALACQLTDKVIVHGDITGENILVRPDMTPVIIDFADSLLAPSSYELPALVFELMRCDREMLRTIRGKTPLEQFVDQLADGLSLHGFAANIILEFAKRNGIDPEQLSDLNAIRRVLLSMWR